MYQICEIIELESFGIKYTTIGMVIKLSPLGCQLRDGVIYQVKSATVRKLRPEIQAKFRHLFNKDTKWNRIKKQLKGYTKKVSAYLLVKLDVFNVKCLIKKLWKDL